MMEEVTINIDASFRDKRAGYAFWIETSRGSLFDMGVLEDEVPNSSVAELLTFERAFRYLENAFPPGTLFDMMVYSDSMWVVSGLLGVRLKFKGIQTNDFNVCRSIIHATRHHRITTHHVKAHQNKLKSPQEIANNWCDFHAREELRKELR